MPRESLESRLIAPLRLAAGASVAMPPDDLPEAAQALWGRIVASREPAFFADAGSRVLLRQLVQATTEADRLAAMLNDISPLTEVEIYTKLSRLIDMHRARASQATTRLRLSKQAQTDSRGAGRAAGRGGVALSGLAAVQALKAIGDD